MILIFPGNYLKIIDRYPFLWPFFVIAIMFGVSEPLKKSGKKRNQSKKNFHQTVAEIEPASGLNNHFPLPHNLFFDEAGSDEDVNRNVIMQKELDSGRSRTTLFPISNVTHRPLTSFSF